MHTPETLIDIHERSQVSLRLLIEHCQSLSAEELNRDMGTDVEGGFSYPTVASQLHHAINGQRYWLSVLRDEMDAEEFPERYVDVDSLEAFRQEVASALQTYLKGAKASELNSPTTMAMWGGREATLQPAHVVLRTVTHIYHHMGQVTAMCRLLGKSTRRFGFSDSLVAECE